MMNNHIDEIWFDKRDVFNKNGEPTEHIEFQKDTDWKKYVDSRRLEITWHEAPYLVSRYNVESMSTFPYIGASESWIANFGLYKKMHGQSRNGINGRSEHSKQHMGMNFRETIS